MVELFLITICVLAVVLYLQARVAAWRIRRNRREQPAPVPSGLPALAHHSLSHRD
ncbi:MAG: hypothetical protein GJ676_13085 [Rhodobacteraceae bacterium]|nr:hypothetical protein [Paracoccaceae bacterium]